MRAVIKRGFLAKKKPPERITTINAICNSGSSCTAVTSSPVCSGALQNLKTACSKLGTSVGSRDALLLSYRAACKVVQQDTVALDKSATTYMNAVDDLAVNDPVIITESGFAVRGDSVPTLFLGRPTNLRGEMGKLSMEGIARWDAVPGASAYKLRVNFTPSNPAGYVELSPGRSRRRVINAPAPAAQFLVCVASIGGNRTSDWSDPILITAR